MLALCVCYVLRPLELMELPLVQIKKAFCFCHCCCHIAEDYEIRGNSVKIPTNGPGDSWRIIQGTVEQSGLHFIQCCSSSKIVIKG